MNFTETLANWYNQNKRDLPWRNTADPYIIWLSEIILQQTQVNQGMPYFNRFLSRYPTITDFALASEDDVLALWQGLGYYSRGRNMLKTAQLVQEKFNGVFPNQYDDLIALKGIGQYTASAISSFAANQAKAVVDGNVSRVIARYFGISEPINSTKGKKLFQQVADELLNPVQPGLHNQAMMEFGAMLCKPKRPDCPVCPVRAGCYALQHKEVAKLPVKLNTVKVRDRYFNYFLITNGDEILMNKRGDNDIWANMYDLPLIETSTLKTPEEILSSLEMAELFGITSQVIQIYPLQKHILTHQRIYARFIHINFGEQVYSLKPTWTFIKVEFIKNLAIPKLIFVFLANIFK